MLRSPAFIVAVVVLALTASPAIAELRVGASAVEITPRLCGDATPDSSRAQFDANRRCFRWVHLAGFGPFLPFQADNRLARGIHDPLWARALVVEGTNSEISVLVSTDLPGLGAKHAKPIRRRVEQATGVPVANIIIHSTHTHSAPDVSGYWSTLIRDHNHHYAHQVREWVYEAIRSALGTRQPATMRVATTTHVSCHDPITGRLGSDPDCRLPDINNQFEDGDSFDRFLIQRDQRDPIVRNTRIVAAEFTTLDGQTIATLVNWHNHPDTLGSANRLISSDYPHYVRQYVERARGGVAVFFAGTLGNQLGALRGTPVPLWSEQGEPVFKAASPAHGKRVRVLVTEGWEKIRSIGFEIGAAAVAALDRVEPSRDVPVAVHARSFETPVDNVIHLLGTWSVWHNGVDTADRLRYGWPQCWGILGCVRGEVALVQLGKLSLVTAPGEIDPAYVVGRRRSAADYGPAWGQWEFPAIAGIDRLMPGTHHAVIGSANDYLSYMIPKSDYVGWWNTNHPNHYEDAVTIGKRFGDDVYRAWLDLLRESSVESAWPGR